MKDLLVLLLPATFSSLQFKMQEQEIDEQHKPRKERKQIEKHWIPFSFFRELFEKKSLFGKCFRELFSVVHWIRFLSGTILKSIFL
jgi:hypothetical protein